MYFRVFTFVNQYEEIETGVQRNSIVEVYVRKPSRAGFLREARFMGRGDGLLG